MNNDVKSEKSKTKLISPRFMSILDSIKNEYLIYLLIMILCVLIRWIPVSSGSQNIDNTINDIAIGGFSSTLVAMLIAWDNNKRISKERKALFNRVTESLFSKLFQYLSSMENELFGNDLKELSKFHVIRSDSLRTLGDDWAAGIDQWEYLRCFEMQNKISQSAEKILDQEFDLINEKVITAEDIDSIRNLKRCIIDFNEDIITGISKEIHWAKLVIRHNYIVDLFEHDDLFVRKLEEMYPKYYKKYQYGKNT